MSQHGHLIEPIARLLCHSTTGLFRKEIFDRLGDDHGIEDIQLVSLAVQELEKAGHLRKGSRESTKGFRWEATPQGRAYYSELNAETEQGETQKGGAVDPSIPCGSDDGKGECRIPLPEGDSLAVQTPNLFFSSEKEAETADHGEIDDKLDLLAAQIETANTLHEIKNLSTKLHILTKLSDLMDPSISSYLDDIKNDLNQLAWRTE